MTDNWKVPTKELEGGAFLRREQTLTFRLQLGEFVFSRKSFNALVLHFELGERPEIERLAAINLHSGSHEVVFFPRADAALRGRFLRLSSGLLWYAPRVSPVYCVDLTGSFEEYLQRSSKNFRKRLKQQWERFKGLSGDRKCFREYRRPEEMKDFCCTARSISIKTYQERLLGAGLPNTPEFVEELIRCAQCDLIRGYVLFDKDRPVAFGYLSGRGDKLTYHLTGYDPAYATYSPGKVLMYCVLESLFGEKHFEVVDFDMGESLFKSSFSTHSFTCADIYCFRLSARNIAFVLVHASLGALSAALVWLTRGIGIKDRIKKWARASLGIRDREAKPAV